jgi:hypothetical protein
MPMAAAPKCKFLVLDYASTEELQDLEIGEKT